MADSESNTSAVEAKSPFNRSDADVVFQTSDGVHFRLHMQTLIMSSTVLDEMIKGLVDNESEATSPQTLDVPEPSSVLDPLFRFCYPVVDPSPNTLVDVRDVLNAATKYAILAAIEPLKELLINYMPTVPVRVYAIACRNNLRQIACQAATFVSNGSLFERSYPELHSMPADVYWNLVDYYRESSPPKRLSAKALAKSQNNPASIDISRSSLKWTERLTFGSPTPLETSWAALAFDGFGTDVVIRSSDAVHFRVHKWILSAASPFFRQMFGLPQPDVDNEEIPVIPVSEPREVLEYLVELIYPSYDEPRAPPLGLLHVTLVAAAKYEMDRPIAVLKRTLKKSIRAAPVGVFLIACRHGFDDIAIESMRLAMQKPLLERKLDGYDEVEESIDPRIDVSAVLIHRILQNRTVYLRVVEGSDWDAVASQDEKWSDVQRALKEPCQVPDGSKNSENACTWLTDYGATAKTSLKRTAISRALPDGSAVYQYLTRAGRCETCRGKAHLILPVYRRMILEHMNSKIQEI